MQEPDGTITPWPGSDYDDGGDDYDPDGQPIGLAA
jgi:hypothetical protein